MPGRSARDPRPRPGREALRPGPGRGRRRCRDHGGPRLTSPSHAAVLAPFRPETAWRIEGGDLIETTGKRERRLPLASLRSIRLTPRGAAGRQAAWLIFARGRVGVPSHSLAGVGVYEDRRETFGAFVRAVAARAADAGAPVRIATTAGDLFGSMIGIVGMLGFGAIALLFFSLTSGTAGLGVTLASRLLFVLILIFAVTPWFSPSPRKLDPRDLPRDLLP